ncbi:MAG: hypothetical protein PHH59_11805 [Methylovulum sp.]|uniref:hypothetical protein n=1 Tax=Methylovulum sp. TaxID=1916980 RepID=UPI00260B1EFA|nr:hypothetical protein [Methylovulum sp.]MDD2724691.1 hypothetical protein [Methylovulum sp.]MDD5124996.1 hypothetical protein [Methylovulum sp.]
MQYLSIYRKPLTIILLSLLASACASTPPPAPQTPARIISDEQMLRDSQGMAHLGNRWKSGKELTERGNNLVREGQTKVEEGNRLIEEGSKIMRESEESYKNMKN